VAEEPVGPAKLQQLFQLKPTTGAVHVTAS
jgi:hypothetical protein